VPPARRLSRGRLALTGGKNAAHDHFLHLIGLDSSTLDRGADRGGSELRSGEILQLPLKGAHGCSRGGNDDDRVVQHGGVLRFT